MTDLVVIKSLNTPTFNLTKEERDEFLKQMVQQRRCIICGAANIGNGYRKMVTSYGIGLECWECYRISTRWSRHPHASVVNMHTEYAKCLGYDNRGSAPIAGGQDKE